MKRLLLTAASAAALFTSAAQATVITFVGADNGAPVAGPFPNSAAAETSFLGAAGTVSQITFESEPNGYVTPFNPAAGVTVSLGSNNFGEGFSGISSTTFSNLNGFNTTSGGTKWLGAPASTATFQFAIGANAFGVWLTGLQTVFSGANGMQVIFDGAEGTTLTVTPNGNGGAQFFGFTSTSAFTSVTLRNLTNDAWGIDDVWYSSQSPGQVSEPATLALLGAGLLGLAAVRRRKAA